jgi:hypothetical protein
MDKEIFAFVLMPFSKEFDDVYKIGIKEAAEKVEIKAQRLDEQMFVEGMLERIYRQIEVADIVIADMTGKNPNVFYEVGYAHAKNKICILLTSIADDIPFDLKHRRHIVYGNSISLLKNELIKNLDWAKTEIENSRKSSVKIEFKSKSNEYIDERFLVRGKINFVLDLNNESKKESVEVDAIYLYTGKQWNVKQDNKPCPETSSDISDYKYRYFLTPSLQKLRPNTWSQITFSTTKILADKIQGDTVKESYLIGGQLLLRIVTSQGIFDYVHPVNEVIDNFPF